MSTRTVLVADDNQDSRTILCAVFRHSGYTVIEAPDGEYALQLARDRAVTLVVCELYVPVGDAPCLAEVLKHRAETAAIPVLVVTSRVMPADWQHAREAGCDAILGKPLDLHRVMEIAEELTGSSRPAPISSALDPSPPGRNESGRGPDEVGREYSVLG